MPVTSQNRLTTSTAFCTAGSLDACSVASSAYDSDATGTALSITDNSALIRMTEIGHPCRMPLVTSK
ncbi:hypothetical protein DIPPA_31779 [Diplonema papillatum]|nr:hypothetical protein DIPPA_31779 [Diplonema papillatum]